MSAQHTTGPWEVVRMNQFGPHAIRMAYAGDKTFYGVRQIHRAEDAALIAAAPDLLAALQGAMDILGRAESNASGNPEFDYVGPSVAACRAAIAKATQP